MKRIKIDTLDKLEAFINNESVSVENRLSVFKQALKQYSLWIMEVKNGTGGDIEQPERVVSEMLRVVKQLQADPEKFIAGFVFTRITI